jgi:hypothetical protein
MCLSLLTTGLVFFVECHKHSAKIILYSTKSLSSVTFGKYFIDKEFFADYFFRAVSKNTRQRKHIFIHSAKSLPSFTLNKNTQQRKTHIYSLGKAFTKFYTRQKTPLTYPSFYHFSSFLIFKSNLCVLRMVRFELATPRARITSSTTTILYQLCLYYIFIPRIL